MSTVTCDMAMSADGFVAGPNQTLDNPFGDGVDDRLHRWMFEQAEANASAIEGLTSAGAYVMGEPLGDPWGTGPVTHLTYRVVRAGSSRTR